jgi:hypothetical protein
MDHAQMELFFNELQLVGLEYVFQQEDEEQDLCLHVVMEKRLYLQVVYEHVNYQTAQ